MVHLDVVRIGPGSGTVTSTPDGIDCPGVCVAEFDLGTEITLTARAEPGARLVGWTGVDCGSHATCTFSFDHDLNVGAEFQPVASSIPTLSVSGIVALILVLMAAGVGVLRRR